MVPFDFGLLNFLLLLQVFFLIVAFLLSKVKLGLQSDLLVVVNLVALWRLGLVEGIAQKFGGCVELDEVGCPNEQEGGTLAMNLDVFRCETRISFLDQNLLSFVNVFSFCGSRCHLFELNFQSLSTKQLSGRLPIQILEPSERANDLHRLFNQLVGLGERPEFKQRRFGQFFQTFFNFNLSILELGLVQIISEMAQDLTVVELGVIIEAQLVAFLGFYHRFDSSVACNCSCLKLRVLLLRCHKVFNIRNNSRCSLTNIRSLKFIPLLVFILHLFEFFSLNLFLNLIQKLTASLDYNPIKLTTL